MITPGKQETHPDWNTPADVLSCKLFSHSSTLISRHVVLGLFFFSLSFCTETVIRQASRCYLAFRRSPCADEPGRSPWTGTAWSCLPRSLCICSGSRTGSRARGNRTPTTAGSTFRYLKTKRKTKDWHIHSDVSCNRMWPKPFCIVLFFNDTRCHKAALQKSRSRMRSITSQPEAWEIKLPETGTSKANHPFQGAWDYKSLKY